MFLIELWNEYVSKTMPALTAGGVPLVVIQMLGGLPPLAGLYRSVRRDSMGERVMLCVVPGIFVVTAAIVEPLFFDSFLGDGFPWTRALQEFLYQPRFFKESLVLSWSFLAAAAATLMAQRWDGQFSIRGYLLSVGAGMVVSTVVLALSIDYFLLGGILFPLLGGQAVKWLVYGIYLLLYQLCVLLVCLVWRLLFSERRSVGYGTNYKQWLRRYLARGFRAYGWSALMFAALWAFAIVYGLYREGSPYGWAVICNVVLVAIGVVCLACSLVQPDYRRIMSWGNPEETLDQLYHELVELEPVVKTDIGFLTEHYMVVSVPKRIFCRALLEKPPKLDPMGAYVLRFRDGGRCRINRCYSKLLTPLLNPGEDEGRGEGMDTSQEH